MSICPIPPPGPLVPDGHCFNFSNNIDRSMAAFKKCCGPAPVAQLFSDTALECMVYCPIVKNGPSGEELFDCLAEELGESSCIGSEPASPEDIKSASEAAKNTGICSLCLAGIQATKHTTTATKTTKHTTTATTTATTTDSERASNTAMITTAPSRTGTSRAATTTTSSTSTNAAVGIYQADVVPWKVGFTMGAMLFTGAIAGLLI
ncbi:hypothetical protein J3F84DRAFT_400111 [Trichoderma pleuroticola]